MHKISGWRAATCFINTGDPVAFNEIVTEKVTFVWTSITLPPYSFCAVHKISGWRAATCRKQSLYHTHLIDTSTKT